MTAEAPGPGGNRQSPAAKLNTKEKENIALGLRLAGATFEQVATHKAPDGTQLYANRGNAHKAVARALNNIPMENARAVRDMELQRLDVALMAIWPAVRRGDVFAIDRMIGIQNRRARYLGLDERIPEDNTGDVKAALIGFLAAAQTQADALTAPPVEPVLPTSD